MADTTETNNTGDVIELIQTKLDEIIANGPDELKPLAVKYGPLILTWSLAEAKAWVELMLLGKFAEAQRILVERLPAEGRLSEYESIVQEIMTANIASKEQRDDLKELGMDLLKGVLSLLVTLMI